MNLTEIVAQVISTTNRPDLGFVADGGDAQIPNAVFASTMAMHTRDFYWRDIVAADVIFDAGSYIQTLDKQTMPRFRAISYFRKWDPSFAAMQLNPTILPPLYTNAAIGAVNADLALKELKIIDLGHDGVFDSYDTERQDVVYGAGSTIFIKSSTLLTQGKIGYYAYPMLDVSNAGAGYSSWIADEYPWAIIHHACYIISTNTGDLDKARELIRPAIPARNDPGGLIAQATAALDAGSIELSGR